MGASLNKFFTDRQFLAAVSVNLMPVAGVILFGWDAGILMMLYWLENLIIGIVTMGKMLVGNFLRENQSALAAIPHCIFFLIHYGIFCFVHGIFVWVIFIQSDTTPNSFGGFPGAIAASVIASPDILFGFIFLAIVHAVFFVLWALSDAWRKSTAVDEMTNPYTRMILLHLTLIVAGLPVLALGQPMAGVLILALIKTWYEISLARRHHFPAFDEAEAQAAQEKLENLFSNRRH